MISKLDKLFEPEEIVEPLAPPVALSLSHVALLLAAGRLDGYVDGPRPGVVRGVYYKEQYAKEPGLLSERPVVYARVLYKDTGKIEEHR